MYPYHIDRRKLLVLVFTVVLVVILLYYLLVVMSKQKVTSQALTVFLDTVKQLLKVKQLLQELSSEEELKNKVISFATHVSKFEVERPIVDEKKGTVLIYLTVSGDIGKVSIPIVITVYDTSQAKDVAKAIYELISDYILKFIRSAYELVQKHVNEIKQPEDELPSVAQIVVEVLEIATDDRFNELTEFIGSRILNFKLVCDTTDKLVKVEPNPDLSNKNINISKIVRDMLDFANRLWNVFILRLISSLVSSE